MGDGLLGFFPLTKILKLLFKNSYGAREQELINDVRKKNIFNKKISDRELVTQVRIYLEMYVLKKSWHRFARHDFSRKILA